ncbi:MAG: carbohydrate kinase family protein, partial [Clostridia bacterium]|nr:carbohydrate kinase family protein [Clostridia bacterium]
NPEQMQKYGIDTAGVLVTEDAPTSFSDVMSDVSSGERTFFHARGANALFAPEDIPVDALDCRIFHIGYILLLDRMDEADPTYGTKLAGLLKRVQEKGIKTSIDVVSDATGRFREKVAPALRYCDYAIMNEIEGCGVSGLAPRKADGSIDADNMRSTMQMMLDMGVRDRVILHSKEAGFMLTKDGQFRMADAVDIDPARIAGKVGAGDAFCAGCLYGLLTGIPDADLLDYASAAAVCNLTAADSISGMKTAEEIRKIVQENRK